MTMLSDVMPTGFERGVKGNVRPGSTVAIVGAGPVGLAALLTARLFSPADIFMVDVDYNRLEIAKSFGATALVDNTDGSARDAVMRLAGNRGVDIAIEAVGIPKTFELCEGIIAPGGVIANIGVHGVKVALDLEQLGDRDVTITTGLVDTSSIPTLIGLVRARKIDPSRLISHRFKLEQIDAAYETFRNGAKTMALKVIVNV
jgi:alcohol dehydrogenase